MRDTLARLIQPATCDHKIRLVMSAKHADRYDPETGGIIPGSVYEMWQTCGLRPRHEGELSASVDFGGAAQTGSP